jgi:hypothetical protein
MGIDLEHDRKHELLKDGKQENSCELSFLGIAAAPVETKLLSAKFELRPTRIKSLF